MYFQKAMPGKLTERSSDSMMTKSKTQALYSNPPEPSSELRLNTCPYLKPLTSPSVYSHLVCLFSSSWVDKPTLGFRIQNLFHFFGRTLGLQGQDFRIPFACRSSLYMGALFLLPNCIAWSLFVTAVCRHSHFLFESPRRGAYWRLYQAAHLYFLYIL
ncbi:hypothetical protein K504DRAFT_227022 [Pleomassaria siparia CBS 279.74]|uniref:Uncharacterized protein n=1 Tax=Pleomassaria siparia CBS 279.74 TaxID=1314801 RepID=A0A6G1KFQ8_9PLEO|nr:hypothetical protein K504DRAFT_227022 [Pleomassaria siparia CBS 279.74]